MFGASLPESRNSRLLNIMLL